MVRGDEGGRRQVHGGVAREKEEASEKKKRPADFDTLREIGKQMELPQKDKEEGTRARGDIPGPCLLTSALPAYKGKCVCGIHCPRTHPSRRLLPCLVRLLFVLCIHTFLFVLLFLPATALTIDEERRAEGGGGGGGMPGGNPGM